MGETRGGGEANVHRADRGRNPHLYVSIIFLSLSPLYLYPTPYIHSSLPLILLVWPHTGFTPSTMSDPDRDFLNLIFRLRFL